MEHSTAYSALDMGRRNGGPLAVVALAACAISIACSISTMAAFAQPFPAGPEGATLLSAHHAAASPLPLPHKFAVELVTPRQLQLSRGACWIFALGGVLEHSYRKHAVAAGWMKPSHYLRVSEQGIGAAMTRACGLHPGVCKTGDDDEAYSGNSTEGGEIEWLYYLQK